MKITVQRKNNGTGDVEVALSDDMFDCPGWVTLSVDEADGDVHIDDLYSAVKAFHEKYIRGLERDKLLS